jgi:hippurate hydrolase
MTRADEVLEKLGVTRVWQEELYRHLHAHPELSSHETETAAQIARRIEGFGYDVHSIGGGVVGVLANGPGATVLMRADIDAMQGRRVRA